MTAATHRNSSSRMQVQRALGKSVWDHGTTFMTGAVLRSLAEGAVEVQGVAAARG